MGFFARLLLLLLLVVAAAEAAVLYLGYEREQALQARVSALESQVAGLSARLERQEQAFHTLEQKSVGALVERANAVIVEGWDAIVDSVESELSRARDALQTLNTPQSSAPALAPAPAPADQDSDQ